MEIGAPSTLHLYEVNIPSEITAQIIHHVDTQGRERMRTLWACCLLSKAWYEAAIVVLYERPNITNKNFDKFARTMCPPVNAHVKHVGIEQLVRHLDMGHLAYESTKSLTARLIRRTRLSLEVFVAPATSFSVSSLAPLSKCINLRVLDLSRDFNVTRLDQLLKSIVHLPIESLNLPKSAFRELFDMSFLKSDSQIWPSKLRHLGINEQPPRTVFRWQDLIEALPLGLESLSFNECPNWERFHYLPTVLKTNTDLRTISITLHRADEGFPIDLLLGAFPSATELFVPSPMTDLHITTLLFPRLERHLQELHFTNLPNAIRQKPQLTCEFLWSVIDAFYEIHSIHLPQAYFKVTDEDLDEIDRLNAEMAARVSEGAASGIYLT